MSEFGFIVGVDSLPEAVVDSSSREREGSLMPAVRAFARVNSFDCRFLVTDKLLLRRSTAGTAGLDDIRDGPERCFASGSGGAAVVVVVIPVVAAGGALPVVLVLSDVVGSNAWCSFLPSCPTVLPDAVVDTGDGWAAVDCVRSCAFDDTVAGLLPARVTVLLASAAGFLERSASAVVDEVATLRFL